MDIFDRQNFTYISNAVILASMECGISCENASTRQTVEKGEQSFVKWHGINQGWTVAAFARDVWKKNRIASGNWWNRSSYSYVQMVFLNVRSLRYIGWQLEMRLSITIFIWCQWHWNKNSKIRPVPRNHLSYRLADVIIVLCVQKYVGKDVP